MARPREEFESRPDESGEAASSGKPPQLVGRMRDRVSAEVDTQKHRATKALFGIATTVRRMGEPLQGQPYEGAAGYIDAAAGRLERFAEYLETRKADELVQDLRTVARRRPAVFIGLGVLTGALCGRFLKSSAPNGQQP